jgi:hypothetical protein
VCKGCIEIGVDEALETHATWLIMKAAALRALIGRFKVPTRREWLHHTKKLIEQEILTEGGAG